MFRRGAGLFGRLYPIAAITILGVIVWSSGIVGAQTSTHPAAETTGPLWDRVVADVIVRRAVVKSEEDADISGPEVRYVWTRSRAVSGWKTKLTLKSATRPPVKTLDGQMPPGNPSPVAWIEDDEDGTPLRLYDKRGVRIRPPDAADRRVLGEPRSGPFKWPSAPVPPRASSVGISEDTEIVVFAASRKERRRDALVRRFGESTGRVKGHDRYLTHTDDGTIEMLVDSEWAVPVEVNVVRGQTLVSHTACSYEIGPEGSLLSRSVRGEQRLSKGPFVRIVNEVEFTNVRLERRR